MTDEFLADSLAAAAPTAPLVARTPADLLSTMVSVMGCRPRQSLVLMLAGPLGVGPVIRLDLPAPELCRAEPGGSHGLQGWCAELEDLVQQLCSSGDWSRTFLAAFCSDTSSLQAGDQQWRGPGFLAGPAAVLPLLHAAAQFWAHGLAPEGIWVVDESNDRWGPLPVPGAGPEQDSVSLLARHQPAPEGIRPVEPAWFLPRSGGMMEIASSAVGVRLLVERGSLPLLSDPVRADVDLPVDLQALRMPGPWRTELRRRLSVAARGAGAGPRTVLEALEPLLRREDPSRRGEGRAAADRLLLMSLTGEAASRMAQGLAGSLGTTAVLASAALGQDEAQDFLDRVQSPRPVSGSPRCLREECRTVLDLLSGRRKEPVDQQRLRRLRLVLLALQETSEEPVASWAAATNAMVAWFRGRSSQAEFFLEAALHGDTQPMVRQVRHSMGLVPLPHWLLRPGASEQE